MTSVDEKTLIKKYDSTLSCLGFRYHETTRDGFFGNYEVIYKSNAHFVSLAVTRGEFEVRFGFDCDGASFSLPIPVLEQFYSDNWKELSSMAFSGDRTSDERYKFILAEYCPKIINQIECESCNTVREKLQHFCRELSRYNMKILKESES